MFLFLFFNCTFCSFCVLDSGSGCGRGAPSKVPVSGHLIRTGRKIKPILRPKLTFVESYRNTKQRKDALAILIVALVRRFIRRLEMEGGKIKTKSSEQIPPCMSEQMSRGRHRAKAAARLGMGAAICLRRMGRRLRRQNGGRRGRGAPQDVRAFVSV